MRGALPCLCGCAHVSVVYGCLQVSWYEALTVGCNLLFIMRVMCYALSSVSSYGASVVVLRYCKDGGAVSRVWVYV